MASEQVTEAERADLLDRASRGDIEAMQALAAIEDPTYQAAMREAFHEVLGEPFGEDDDWDGGVSNDEERDGS